jgi:AcrR family transcriptional regulator
VVLRRSLFRGSAGTSECFLKPRPYLLRGESVPHAPLQMRSLQKRERLKAVALTLFRERGYQATAVGDIARRAKLPVGTFYQHYRTKRQLLLALMDELLEKLSRVDLDPQPAADVRSALHSVLTRAFSHDLQYLGAYRAWQEAVWSDPGLSRKHARIHAWTTARVTALFEFLHTLPGARSEVNIPSLAFATDTYFWSLLAQAAVMGKVDLTRHIDAATHLIFHALFRDTPSPPSKL